MKGKDLFNGMSIEEYTKAEDRKNSMRDAIIEHHKNAESLHFIFSQKKSEMEEELAKIQNEIDREEGAVKTLMERELTGVE